MTPRIGLLALMMSVLVGVVTPTEAPATPLPEIPRVQPQPQRGEMRGVVTRSDDGLGIREVRVVLRRDRSREVVSIERTGRGGAFTFDDLPQGVYSLEATAAGFEKQVLAPIVVKPGREVRLEHITLTPEGVGRSDA